MECIAIEAPVPRIQEETDSKILKKLRLRYRENCKEKFKQY